MRMIQIQDNISEQKNLKDKLESEQEKLHMEYNKVSCRKWKKQKKTKGNCIISRVDMINETCKINNKFEKTIKW